MLMCLYIQCFVDHMLTYVLALMIKCSHVYLLRWYVQMLWWSHAPMFTYLDDSMLPCLHALMIICSHVYVLWLSHAHMPVCPHAYMFGCFDDHMITCSHARMLLCSHVITCFACDMCTWNIIFSHAYLWMLAWLFTCLDAYMLECFADHMLPCSHALLIICYYVACFEDNMHTYIAFRMFDIRTLVHTLGWWYTSMLKGLSDYAVARSNAPML